MNASLTYQHAKTTSVLSRLQRIFAIGALTMACGAVAAPPGAVENGYIILRDFRFDKANTDINYEGQDSEGDKLENVSALCGTPALNKPGPLIATDHTRVWRAEYMISNTTTINKLGGWVRKAPMAGNPNHCEINGLTKAQIKGIWAEPR